MLISQLTSEQSGDTIRHSALVEWEQAQRPPQTIFFETDAANLPDDQLRADPFLTAAVFPAMECNEERVHADGLACPVLLSNLRVATMMMAAWRKGRSASSPTISAAQLELATHRPEAAAACMLTGGIDSMATLARNLKTIPRDHPLALKFSILVDGFDIGGFHQDPDGAIFRRVTEHLRSIVCPHGMELRTVRTNLIELLKDVGFWAAVHHGTGCAAVAHFLSRSLSSLSIASSHAAHQLEPWGSVAWMDPYFSSASLLVIHDGAEFNRLEKTQLIMGHDAMRRGTVVCFYPEKAYAQGALNCGECAKCVRTKLAYHLCGQLNETAPFANLTLDAELIARTKLKSEYSVTAYEEMLEHFAAQGPAEIHAAMQGAIADYHERKRREIADRNPLRRLSGKARRKLVRLVRGDSSPA